MLSRRRLFQFLALFTSVARRAVSATTTPPLQVDRLLSSIAGPKTRAIQRQYRADATILVLSIPILRRTSVGSGTVSVEEYQRAAERRVSLRFAAGSLPERAHGLNRLGLLHEVVIEGEGRPRQAAYFGFITSSPEESFSDGKKALHPTSDDDLVYTIIDASSSGNRTRSSISHLLSPPKYDWSDITALVGSARAKAHGPDAKWRESTWPNGAPSFLYVIYQAVCARDGKSNYEYVYNERRYRLTFDKTKDESAGRHFAQSGLTSNPQAIRVCKGEIRTETTGHKTAFQLWVEENGADLPLPLRIEFQPKSYLRLMFEWDNSVPAPEL